MVTSLNVWISFIFLLTNIEILAIFCSLLFSCFSKKFIFLNFLIPPYFWCCCLVFYSSSSYSPSIKYVTLFCKIIINFLRYSSWLFLIQMGMISFCGFTNTFWFSPPFCLLELLILVISGTKSWFISAITFSAVSKSCFSNKYSCSCQHFLIMS